MLAGKPRRRETGGASDIFIVTRVSREFFPVDLVLIAVSAMIGPCSFIKFTGGSIRVDIESWTSECRDMREYDDEL